MKLATTTGIEIFPDALQCARICINPALITHLGSHPVNQPFD